MQNWFSGLVLSNIHVPLLGSYSTLSMFIVIQVSFQRTLFGEDGEEDTIKTVRRTLFGRANPFPQKKVMTFNRHTEDFNFNVAYNDIEEILSGDMLK